jgi:hypothetical protein
MAIKEGSSKISENLGFQKILGPIQKSRFSFLKSHQIEVFLIIIYISKFEQEFYFKNVTIFIESI